VEEFVFVILQQLTYVHVQRIKTLLPIYLIEQFHLIKTGEMSGSHGKA
jgi:hypothetical protein